MARRLLNQPWVLAALILAIGCHRETKEKRQAAPEVERGAARDVYADGARLSAAQKEWSGRWQRVDPLPNCAPLLKEAAPCERVATALASMKSSARDQASSDAILGNSAALALAAQRAAEQLRGAGLAVLMPVGEDGKKLMPSASSAPAPLAPGAHRHSHAPSAAGSGERKHDNPHLDAIVSYSRVASIALRQLAIYLQFGPLPVRQRALREVERLAGEQPRWSALEHVIDEAALVESDPELGRRLHALRQKLD